MPRAPKGTRSRQDEGSRSKSDRAGRPPARVPPKVPYYEGYFGTDEEKGVERERELGGGDGQGRDGPPRRKA